MSCYVNKKVSILAKNNVRYEGNLLSMSCNDSILQINNVYCNGTENRIKNKIFIINPFDGISIITFNINDIIYIKVINNNSKLDITNEIKLYLSQKKPKELKTNGLMEALNILDELLNNIEYPLFSVGVIADPQYANMDERYDHTKTRIRFYRNSLNITKNAINIWNNMEESNRLQPKPCMIICLGDIIDGCNNKCNKSESAMKDIFSIFNQFNISKEYMNSLKKNILNYDPNSNINNNIEMKYDFIPKFPIFHNCIGNHELYNFGRNKLSDYMYTNNNEYYYSFSPFKGYLFIILDSYKLSTMGYNTDDTHPSIKKGYQILKQNRPPNDNNENSFYSPPNVFDDRQRFTCYNGGFGDKQLKWLQKELIKAQNKQYNVILFGHIPVNCFMSNPKYNIRGREDILAWDYNKIRKLITKYSCIKMYCAGHDHPGWIGKDINNVWYKTFEGAIESSNKTECFGTLFFYNNRVTIKGYGINNHTLYFRPF